MEEHVDRYEDMINLPHHTSTARPRMSREARAAQFSPFAALTGYEAAVRETARLTDAERELTEDEKALINEKLLIISEHSGGEIPLAVTYFEEDDRKAGGAYVRACGSFVRIDEFEKALYLSSGERILIERIRSIEAPFLKDHVF